MRKTTGGIGTSAQLASSIFHALPGTVLILNPMGRVLFLSITDDDILGHEPEHWIGQSALDLVHPDDLALVTRRVNSAVEGQAVPRQAVHIRVGVDNNWLKVQAVGFTLIDFEGGSGVVVALRDTTGSSAAQHARRFASDTLDQRSILNNRSRLVDELLPALILAEGPSSQLLLMSLTFTNYRAVVEQVGEAKASTALLKMVRSLEDTRRGDDLIVRVTAEQLVIANVGVSNQAAGLSIARRTHESCLAMMRHQTSLHHTSFDTRIGYALASQGDDFDEVVDFITHAEHFSATAV